MTPLLLTIPLLAAAPIPKEFKRPVPLDGKWKVTEFERNGRPASHFQEMWSITGRQLTITHAAAPNLTPRKLELRLDTTAKPMRWDYTFELNRTSYTMAGVFSVQGNDLVVCFPNFAGYDRPDNLNGGDGTLRYTLSRIKDTSPTPEARR